MPYPAIWTRSQRGQLSADYESVTFPGNTFIFLQKRKTQQCSYFRCAHCAKAMKLRARRNLQKLTVPIVRATLEDGFLDDPDNPFHRHFCIDEEGVDTTTYAAKARYIYNKVKLELLDMPMTPRQAWLQMEAEVIANFPDPLTQQEIIRRLPSDKSAKRSFARRSSTGRRNLAGELANWSGMGWADGDEDEMYYLFDEEADDDLLTEGQGTQYYDGDQQAMNDPRNLPMELLKPYTERPSWVCPPGRARLANFFLIYRDCRTNSPPFMIFSDMMGINLMHKCADIVCDGNSNFYPHGFAQLYTFHAVHNSIPEEAHLCAFALLPNTAPATYLKLFDVLSERIIREFGDQGEQKNWYFDNQLAAISGCRAIFQQDIVEGSEQRTANFAQLWHNHLRTLFHGEHPNLIRFIRIMREELVRASLQAERIFPPPSAITAINLDNIEVMNKLSGYGGMSTDELFPPMEYYPPYPPPSNTMALLRQTRRVKANNNSSTIGPIKLDYDDEEDYYDMQPSHSSQKRRHQKIDSNNVPPKQGKSHRSGVFQEEIIPPTTSSAALVNKNGSIDEDEQIDIIGQEEEAHGADWVEETEIIVEVVETDTADELNRQIGGDKPSNIDDNQQRTDGTETEGISIQTNGRRGNGEIGTAAGQMRMGSQAAEIIEKEEDNNE